MPYIDSNIFLYPMLYPSTTQPKAQKAKEILLRIESGALPGFTSTLTQDEVVWVITKHLGKKRRQRSRTKAIRISQPSIHSSGRRHNRQAQAIMDKYNLAPRDSIHAASALESKTKTIISDDEDFDKVKEIKRTPLK